MNTRASPAFSLDNDEAESPTAISDPVLSSAADLMIDQSPEVSEHVVNAEEIEEPTSDDTSVELDSEGVPYDPNIHAATRTQTAAGRWKKRRGSKSTLAVAPKRKNDAAVTAEVDQTQKARAAGVVAARSMFTLGQMFGGPEWAPISVDKDGAPSMEEYDERKMMEQAFADYFIAKGVTEVSPGMGLTIAMLAYAGPRFTMPQTKARASAAKSWLSLRIAKWKLQRELKKRGVEAKVTVNDGEIFINGSRADSWNDGKRQDDTSEKVSRTVQSTRVQQPRT